MIKSRLEAKAESMGLATWKEYYNKRRKFVLWARDERYTLEEIGKTLGMTKNGVHKILTRDKIHV